MTQDPKERKEKGQYKYKYQKKYAKKKLDFIANCKSIGCAVCGYNKCLKSLHFHHIDNDKEFGISSHAAVGKGMKTIYEEMKKCIVVCANCHGEIHCNLIDGSMYEKFRKDRIPKPKSVKIIDLKDRIESTPFMPYSKDRQLGKKGGK